MENTGGRFFIDRARPDNSSIDRAMKLHKPKAWLRGIRRDQSSTRQDRKIVEWSRRFDLYAISPILTRI